MSAKPFDLRNFPELVKKAYAPDAAQDDIDTLEACCVQFGRWNGEYYDVSLPDEPRGTRILYPRRGDVPARRAYYLDSKHLLTTTQLTLAVTEAANYNDPDAFVSDLLLSSAFLPPEDETAEPDMALAPQLRAIWTATNAPFRDLLAALGLTQTELSRRYQIPLRTVQGWKLGERECPVYVRLMMAELCGLIDKED